MTGVLMATKGGGRGDQGWNEKGTKNRASSSTDVDVDDDEEQNQLSILTILIAAIRKSMVSCRVEEQDEISSSSVEIGWPTNVKHITHVTFDRFNGFLGLPVEFEVEVPSRAPSASASVFGVSPESMQCSFDSKGNSVPTILLLMQERLYSQGGLKAEGIFRINPENSQEEHVRDQLNRGIVPVNIDVHCLAGLIKAWFRELPEGILDGLSPEQVLQCNEEDEFVELVKQLLPIQAALLNWAIDLMADIVEEEESNKMNARNIAMVFAPNMTQMSDPLTALMHAVQVMNLLKSLILKSLREREETATQGDYSPASSRSYERQTDEEDFDSQEEDDEMDTSSETRRTSSDYYEDTHYSPSSEDEEEINQLNETENCLLRQLNETKEQQPMDSTQGLSESCETKRLSSPSTLSNSTESGSLYSDGKNTNKEFERDPNEDSSESIETKQLSSPSTYSGYNAESGFSYSDTKNMGSNLTGMSDIEDSSSSVSITPGLEEVKINER